jgi:hypothetical protein
MNISRYPYHWPTRVACRSGNTRFFVHRNSLFNKMGDEVRPYDHCNGQRVVKERPGVGSFWIPLRILQVPLLLPLIPFSLEEKFGSLPHFE